MKTNILLMVMAWILIATSCVWGFDSSTARNSVRMQKIIYGATIDSKVAFYQGRVYLDDSEFKILADISKDAVKKITFLKTYRQHLIDDMVAKDIKLNRSSLHSFLGTKISDINATMEAYSTE